MKIYARSLPGPGDYDEPDKKEGTLLKDSTEFVDVNIDCNISVDEYGDWDYDTSEDMEWAGDGEWYSDNSGKPVGSSEDILENASNMLDRNMPKEEGRYHISASLTLYFTVEGLVRYEDYLGKDEDGESAFDVSIDSSGAISTFLPDRSKLNSLSVDPLN